MQIKRPRKAKQIFFKEKNLRTSVHDFKTFFKATWYSNQDSMILGKRSTDRTMAPYRQFKHRTTDK